eukprot:Rmarinus@m.22624
MSTLLRDLLNEGEEPVEIIEESEEENESEIRYGFVLIFSCIALAFFSKYILRKKNITAVQEAGVALVIGLIVGSIIDAHGSKTFKEECTFDKEIFLLFLLPPIIFEAGYSMKRKRFFRNFDSFVTLAFVGTCTAAVITAFLVYIIGTTGIVTELPFLESLVFGALISATDPVTVLAIFGEIEVHPDLYANVFGESVMNDAVAIVLYRTLKQFKDDPVTTGSIFAAIGTFVGIFAGSFVVGVFLGLCAALLLKHLNFRDDPMLHHAELMIVILVPFLSWMLAEALMLSGIVAILFCGITMAHYTSANMSDHTRDASHEFYHILATLCEMAVFLYMGMALFLYDMEWEDFGLSMCAIIIILIARASHLYPLCWIVNRFSRSSGREVPFNHQHMLWVAGLRGAIAFALALDAEEDFEEHGRVILTMTTLIVMATVLGIGCIIHPAIDSLGCRAGLETGDLRSDRKHSISGIPFSKELFAKTLKTDKIRAFRSLDKTYLKPFFCIKRAEHLDENIELQVSTGGARDSMN